MSPLPPPLRPLPLGRREQRVDLVIAAGVFVLALVSVALSAIGGLWGAAQAPLAVGIAYAAVLAAPLALRRRWPGIVTAIVSAAYFVAVTAHIPEVLVGNIAVFLAFYSIGAWTPNRRRANLVRAAIVVAMFAWLVVSMFEAATTATSADVPHGVALSPAIAQVLLSVLINVLYFGAAWGFGDRAWTAGVQRRALEERTAELEREREVTASQAVALERVRIARELHDVVAHHVSLMGVQAGVARTVMASDPALATTSLTQVEGSARSALTELRQLLETLRTSPDADAAPQPSLSLDAIETLVTDAAAAGLPTTLTTVGAPCEVPDLVQVNLVRIAQEALTNARRHGGHDATADVRLRFEADAVELEVANTGRVAASVTPGLGMVGMRERVTVSGGTLELIPRTGGGFIVRARVPLARVEQTS